jgi:hypothetical protein
MRFSSAGLTLLTTLAVAACGGSGSTTIANASGSGGAGGAGVTTTVTRTATAATAGTGSTGGGTVPTGTATQRTGGGSGGSGGAGLPAGGGSSSSAPPCKAATLALSFLGGQGATGHGELGFTVRNSGASSCSTVGYPGVQFLDGSGNALPTTPTHTTTDFFGHTSLRTLTLAPGQSASFRLGVTHSPTSGQTCTTADGLGVIAPNDTATLRVDLSGGAAECGVATVSPMQPGSSAYP